MNETWQQKVLKNEKKLIKNETPATGGGGGLSLRYVQNAAQTAVRHVG